MRKFLADTFAMITFSLVVGMSVEIGISRLTLLQSLQSRAAGTIVNLLTGGLYGKFRDYFFKKMRITNQSHWMRRTIVGMTAFVLFQVPLYAMILRSTGASTAQIIAATGTVTILSGFIGGPYDWYLGLVRRLFRVKNDV